MGRQAWNDSLRGGRGWAFGLWSCINSSCECSVCATMSVSGPYRSSSNCQPPYSLVVSPVLHIVPAPGILYWPLALPYRALPGYTLPVFSYTLVLLVLHFLQCGVTPAVLPSLQELYPDFFSQERHLQSMRLADPLPSPLPGIQGCAIRSCLAQV